jgi:N-acetylmuramoyl-L-alanine amidase
VFDNISSENKLTTKNPTIIIDAGHGGFDGGASTDDGVSEKGINLDIALYLKEYLNLFGFNVVMTRETDTSTESEGLTTIRSKKSSDLHNRMYLMEKTDNAIFVSIHQNHFSSSKYKGAQVFYSPQFSEQSSLLAESIQESIVYYLQKDNKRQIKPCGTSVYLIYKAVKPAVLVECGFLSNPDDSENLQNEIYQRKMALCIAIGILNYCEGQ